VGEFVLGARLHLAVEAVGVKHGGGAVVLRDALRAAVRCSEIDRITVFSSPRDVRRFDMPGSEKIVEAPRSYAEESVIGRLHWLTRGVQAEVRALRPDMLVCMSGIGRTCELVPMVVFIQQSLPFCDEALGRCGLRTQIRIRAIGRLMKRSASHAALVVTQTPSMSDWIRQACGLTDERIMVVKPWGDEIGMDSEQGGSVNAMLRVPAHLRLLYVGNSSPYKNLGCLLAALPEIRRRVTGATLFLTCPSDHSLCKTAGVVGLGYLGGSALRGAYQLATVFVTPSLVESGNLALVEAMTMGTPIAAADRPYARDLCGDAAVYFDPHRPAELAAAISDLIEDEAKRQRLSRRGLEVACIGRSEKPYDSMMERFCALAGKVPGSPFGISASCNQKD
jgi:glycosyltransferase involved in cell wall biosynthesis